MSRHSLWLAYRMRWKRRRLLARAIRKRRQLQRVQDRTSEIQSDAHLCFVCVRNEVGRLPYFLQYHRDMGIGHFLFVDNGSTDGSFDLLRDQPDVSLWRTEASYKASRFGMDWVNWLLIRYGHGHWCLTLDADELLVYPHHTERPIRALTTELDRRGAASFGATMIDLYPKGRLGETSYRAGDDPLETLQWFDGDNYRETFQPKHQNLWIQGGVRARHFFAKQPERAPTMGKIPLVKFNRRYAYVSSTHILLPPRLNAAFDREDASRITGALLHTKFLPSVVARSDVERKRKEHFENSSLYEAYYRSLSDDPVLWHAASTRYEGWRQLEDMGLMSRGGWP